jgi:DNA-binding MarR family transcriptional regulator
MKDFAEWLIELRQWSIEPMRFTDSNIVFDILIHAYWLETTGQNRSMKDIYRRLGYSETRVRSIVRNLEKMDFLYVQAGPDGRQRKFYCTPKLKKLMLEYHAKLKKCP